VASAISFPFGKPTDLALGEKHSCGVFDERVFACWGDGSRGRIGTATDRALTPVKLGEGKIVRGSIAVGGAHSCVRVEEGKGLSCFGADDDGQLGEPTAPFPAPAKAWSRGAPIVSFALGDAHTCAAYGGATPKVLCRGRAVAAPREPFLEGVVVRELAAGADHTCALVEDGSVRCWGKNDSGQLGDGTTNDATVPVVVAGLGGAVQVAAGFRHTCALLRNGTVACWGNNARYQLATGTTENSSHPRIVVGIVSAKELSLAGDGACIRLEGGYARCWGRNDRGELGDGTTIEHTVPMPMKFAH
jgi:alpha-tubulin suppressor-like RCC1 family protein